MKQPTIAKVYNTALYMRLSKDDELKGDSASIQTQRMLLNEYAQEHRMNIVDEYIDDGWSGTNFNRPGFKRMIEDIEEGKINCVITKDLSRLGRNYIMTGQYTEIYFPSKNVRYIAVNDNVDTMAGDNELAPFLNILNEMQARQTSKKVKSALATRKGKGAYYCTTPPLGYKRDPEQKGHLLVDTEHSWIVEKMFRLAVQGHGCKTIARTLAENQIPIPRWFYPMGTIRISEEKKFEWDMSTVLRILRNPVYMGDTVYGKYKKPSFKSPMVISAPKSEWQTVENTHEPLVSREEFYLVQELIEGRHRQLKSGEPNLFSRMLVCSTCGNHLHYKPNNGRKRFMCESNKITKPCPSHYILYDTIYDLVLKRLQYYTSIVQKDEDEMLEMILRSNRRNERSERRRIEEELRRAEKRLDELDDLFVKVYEDRSFGKIPGRVFETLTGKYQGEQASLTEKVSKLKEQLYKTTDETENAEEWIKLLKKYTRPTELTREMLTALIQKIVVHEKVANPNGGKTQEIEIFYRFVGNIGSQTLAL